MDADDISEPERLEQQVRFFSLHSDHVSVGNWYQLIDKAGRVTEHLALPCDHDSILMFLLAHNCLGHGTVMFRNGLGMYYNSKLDYAQDYDLWVRMAGKGKLANISEYLYRRRMHSGNITSVKWKEQAIIANKTTKRHMQNLLIQGRHDLLLCAYVQGIVHNKCAESIRTALMSLPYKLLKNDDFRQRCLQLMRLNKIYESCSIRQIAFCLKCMGPIATTIWGAHFFPRFLWIKLRSVYLHL